MLIQKLNDCEEMIAGDGTVLRELLHPDKQDINLRYSLAHVILPVSKTSIPHSLKTSEVYYIISGVGEMSIDSEVCRIEPGDAVYIPQNAIQFFHNDDDEPIVFVCLVDPAWCEEDKTIRQPLILKKDV